MYWWRVIDGIYGQWEAEKHKPDDEQEGFDYGVPDLGNDAEWDEPDRDFDYPERESQKPGKKRKPGGLKKPVLPRDRKRR